MKRNLSLIVTFLILLISTEVKSYTYTDDFAKGFYWSSFPITMNKFAVKTSDGVLLSQLMQECEDEWESAIGMPIWSIPDNAIISQKFAGNHIRWSDNFAQETGFDDQRTLGVTIRSRVGTYVVRVEIVLNGSRTDLRYNEYKLRKVILHELGHTFGLGHSRQESIMQESIDMAADNLRIDDIDGAHAVVEETLWRQANNFISPNARQDDAFSCATIDTGGSNGPGRFLPSLTLGLIIAFFFRQKRVFLPTR